MKNITQKLKFIIAILLSAAFLSSCCESEDMCTAGDSSAPSVSFGGFGQQIVAPSNLPTQSIGGIGGTIHIGF